MWKNKKTKEIVTKICSTTLHYKTPYKTEYIPIIVFEHNGVYGALQTDIFYNMYYYENEQEE